uniref:DUF6156 family protein n=1 Tax=Pseudacidovorax intermedius TaxID=433924 RepID=UPI0005B774DD
MNESAQAGLRYFSSYSGRGLPLRLVGELPPEVIAHRNTFSCRHRRIQHGLHVQRHVVLDRVRI